MGPVSTLVLGGDSSFGHSDGDDLILLSTEELRSAAGVDDDSEDDALAALGAAVSDILATQCKIRGADGSRPTFFSQSLIETFQIGTPVDVLKLSRWPVLDLESIAVDGSGLADDSFTLVKNSGILVKPRPGMWSGTIVVAYTAGFDVIPANLKYAAKAMVKWLRSAAATDAANGGVRSVTVDGVGSVQYQVDTAAQSDRPLVPAYIAALLAPYANVVIA